jgi:hypothetical protein
VHRRRSLIAAFLAGHLALAPAVAAVHLLVAAHVYCPVHDTLEERTAAPAPAPAPWRALRDAAPDERTAHQPCAGAPSGRARSLAALTRLAPTPNRPRLPAPPTARPDTPRPIPLLATAPKLAPPARAV